ncbi:uncharacterized protein LOC116265875 isoform X3 [Nymphaea colorata]|uniref:uncharacterized protein LOC116265875 isoform X3 n=1 Tax=Nymphaea colorata TaxID=210225 RepID=UPI00214EDC2E|nr:uncharacterized protein LOC116265875 isoform X3 [Nymphaea colorata]
MGRKKKGLNAFGLLRCGLGRWGLLGASWVQTSLKMEDQSYIQKIGWYGVEWIYERSNLKLKVQPGRGMILKGGCLI